MQLNNSEPGIFSAGLLNGLEVRSKAELYICFGKWTEPSVRTHHFIFLCEHVLLTDTD